jgi:hypothetical protein
MRDAPFLLKRVKNLVIDDDKHTVAREFIGLALLLCPSFKLSAELVY